MIHIRDCNGRIIVSVPTCRNADFSDMDLSGAIFYELDCTGAKFTRANLTRVQFHNTNLAFACFESAVLYATKFVSAHLCSTNFCGANMEKSEFRISDLCGADLSGAILTYALFVRCVMTRTNLDNADISGTTFIGTCLDGAVLLKTTVAPGWVCEGESHYLDVTIRASSLVSFAFYKCGDEWYAKLVTESIEGPLESVLAKMSPYYKGVNVLKYLAIISALLDTQLT